jgi:hypothetical protein
MFYSPFLEACVPFSKCRPYVVAFTNEFEQSIADTLRRAGRAGFQGIPNTVTM